MIEIVIGLLLILILGLVIIYVRNTIIICLAVFGIITILGFGIWKLLCSSKEKFQLKFIDDQANIDIRPEIYCGEDANLPVDYDRMGTRGVCLKKGIGIGMGMPSAARDSFLAKPPKQVVQKLYCGDGELPEGYVGFDTMPNCLRRGVGVGLAMPEVKRIAFQSKPTRPLGKKEIMDLARRLGIRDAQDMTRANALRTVAGHI
jgi:hypothetical protein